jgi:hypothetical protein
MVKSVANRGRKQLICTGECLCASVRLSKSNSVCARARVCVFACVCALCCDQASASSSCRCWSIADVAALAECAKAPSLCTIKHPHRRHAHVSIRTHTHTHTSHACITFMHAGDVYTSVYSPRARRGLPRTCGSPLVGPYAH